MLRVEMDAKIRAALALILETWQGILARLLRWNNQFVAGYLEYLTRGTHRMDLSQAPRRKKCCSDSFAKENESKEPPG